MKRKTVKPPIDYEAMIKETKTILSEYEKHGHKEVVKIKEFIKILERKVKDGK